CKRRLGGLKDNPPDRWVIVGHVHLMAPVIDRHFLVEMKDRTTFPHTKQEIEVLPIAKSLIAEPDFLKNASPEEHRCQAYAGDARSTSCLAWRAVITRDFKQQQIADHGIHRCMRHKMFRLP